MKDNATHYINKMGGTKSLVLTCLALDLWDWCLQRSIHAEAQYLPGVLNVRADRVQSNVGSARLEIRSPSIFKVKPDLELTRGRSICLPNHNSTAKILQLETRPFGRGFRCLLSGLDKSERICISSLCSSRQMPETNVGQQHSISSVSGTSLAVATMVPSPSRDVHSTSSTASTSRLATISQSYSTAGISQSAQNLLVAAWHKGTTTTYASAWRKWDGWCRERKINSIRAPVESILEFLTSELNAGKAYRTLNVYRSAISSAHSYIDSARVGEHPLVVQLLKGVYNLRPHYHAILVPGMYLKSSFSTLNRLFMTVFQKTL